MKRELSSFKCAFSGLYRAVRQEGHLRFHLVAAAYVFFFAALCRFSWVEFAVLSLTVGGVLAAELINTAVERLSDRVCSDRDSRIGLVKDISAGAVLVWALAAAAVAVFLFLCDGRLVSVLSYIITSPLCISALAASAIISVLFVAFFRDKRQKK